MGTTLRRTTHRPVCVHSLMLNLLIRLVTEVIFFYADHKLWSKTSITRWANAISIQQPYNSHEPWVLPQREQMPFQSMRDKQWGFTKGGIGKEEGESNVMIEPWCYQVIGVRLGVKERKVSSVLSARGEDVIPEEFCQFCLRYQRFISDEHSTVCTLPEIWYQ